MIINVPTLSSNNKSSSLLLIEPSGTGGVKQVVNVKDVKKWFSNKEDWAKKSEEAMNNAMKTIQDMAQRVNSTIEKIDEDKKPDTAEVEFGLKFNGNLDVIIAQAGVEASITVTLGWDLNKS